MNVYEELVTLKLQEKELKSEIKDVQQKVLEEAQKLDKTGKIAEVNGAKITYKIVTVKPKPTDTIVELEEKIDELRTTLEIINAKRIRELKAELNNLLTNDELTCLEQSLEQEWASLTETKQPQIAVTLPK
jgi:hypothetical protein